PRHIRADSRARHRRIGRGWPLNNLHFEFSEWPYALSISLFQLSRRKIGGNLPPPIGDRAVSDPSQGILSLLNGCQHRVHAKLPMWKCHGRLQHASPRGSLLRGSLAAAFGTPRCGILPITGIANTENSLF